MLTLALRLPDIGNPLIDLDEQFYLLVGDRMLHGAIPYVDIWDRKPVGLFLIYAAARAIGGDAWIGYQIVAAMAAMVTAGLIAALARGLANGWGGLAAGAVYLVWIALLGGRGGQAPVFYNGLVAGAALLTWLAIVRPESHRRHGLWAMLLIGLALQIKPTVVFEGAWFGLALLIAEWRHGSRPTALIGYALTLAGIALVPTLIAYAVYVGIGHGEAWWFANIRSIFLRVTPPGEPIAGGRLIGMALNLMIPAGAAWFGVMRSGRGARWVIGGWLVAAVMGVLAIPPYFNHYALPLVVPIAVLAGVGMARSRPFAIPGGRVRRGVAAAVGLSASRAASCGAASGRGAGNDDRPLSGRWLPVRLFRTAGPIRSHRLVPSDPLPLRHAPDADQRSRGNRGRPDRRTATHPGHPTASDRHWSASRACPARSVCAGRGGAEARLYRGRFRARLSRLCAARPHRSGGNQPVFLKTVAQRGLHTACRSRCGAGRRRTRSHRAATIWRRDRSNGATI